MFINTFIQFIHTYIHSFLQTHTYVEAFVRLPHGIIVHFPVPIAAGLVFSKCAALHPVTQLLSLLPPMSWKHPGVSVAFPHGQSPLRTHIESTNTIPYMLTVSLYITLIQTISGQTHHTRPTHTHTHTETHKHL